VISAVDTNVILDVLTGDPRFGPASVVALRRASALGSLIVSTTVWAEVCAAFEDALDAAGRLEQMAMELVPDDAYVAAAAGTAWRHYRRSGGTRRRVLPDFLIAAHAASKADRLITRDRGFYRSHFPALTIHDPVAPRGAGDDDG
jgi:predicted nucleic acid-binding protein